MTVNHISGVDFCVHVRNLALSVERRGRSVIPTSTKRTITVKKFPPGIHEQDLYRFNNSDRCYCTSSSQSKCNSYLAIPHRASEIKTSAASVDQQAHCVGDDVFVALAERIARQDPLALHGHYRQTEPYTDRNFRPSRRVQWHNSRRIRAVT